MLAQSPWIAATLLMGCFVGVVRADFFLSPPPMGPHGVYDDVPRYTYKIQRSVEWKVSPPIPTGIDLVMVLEWPYLGGKPMSAVLSANVPEETHVLGEWEPNLIGFEYVPFHPETDAVFYLSLLYETGTKWLFNSSYFNISIPREATLVKEIDISGNGPWTTITTKTAVTPTPTPSEGFRGGSIPLGPVMSASTSGAAAVTVTVEPAQAEPASGHITPGALAGIAAGASVAGILVIAGAAFFFWNNHKKRSSVLFIQQHKKAPLPTTTTMTHESNVAGLSDDSSKRISELDAGPVVPWNTDKHRLSELCGDSIQEAP